ncbi:1774_t:CDS:2 [Cetraspora pellucida]|uniref:1774_t:CDS:1 n=1 Tax=Cetraspora pellucida TaxID=1433469 RepID=A0A9N9CLZ5_9GLOM|nr:1774_t:CDS:2 [Cetraspora pellucida]
MRLEKKVDEIGHIRYNKENDIWYDDDSEKKKVPVNKNLPDNSANPSSDLATIHPETYDQLLSKLSLAMRKMYNRSEFEALNDATINALRWKADKPSDFDIKSNSKHITKSLGWFTDVPVSIKDEDGKTVTATGNFIRIDNSESEPMLCLTPEVSRSKDAITSKDLVQVFTISSSLTTLKAGKVLVKRCSQLTETKMGA